MSATVCATQHWVWCRPEEANTVLLAHPHMTPVLQAEFQGSVWSLIWDLMSWDLMSPSDMGPDVPL